MKKILSSLTFLIIAITSLSAQKTVPKDVMNKIYEEVKTPYKYGLVVSPADNFHKIDCPTIFRKNGKWYMSYLVYNGKSGKDGRGYETWLAESDDLLRWNTLGRILSFPKIGSGRWDENQRAGYIALIDYEWGGNYQAQKFDNKYWMSYFGGTGKGYEQGRLEEGIAYTEGDITKPHEWKTFDKPRLSPIDPDKGWWENITQYKSSVIWDKKKTLGYPFVMYYNAGGINPANNVKAERIGIALSDDMVNWKRYEGNPIVNHEEGITGDGVIQKIGDVYVMFYFSAFRADRPYKAFNTFACSYDLINWTDWDGDDLIIPTEKYDNLFAHKSYVVKWNGVVYHFYCAVNEHDQRAIAVATSKDLGKSLIRFPKPEKDTFRKEISLNNGWKTTANDTDKDAHKGFEAVNYNDKDWQQVSVPHNWDKYEGVRRLKHGNKHGHAWYRKEFNVEKQGEGKRYFLYFEGVGSYATVYVNGKKVGYHAGGRTTFTLDVTDVLNFDRSNTLAVQADHPPMIADLPWVCGGCSSEWGFSEGSQPMGIFRPVTLVVSNDVRVEPFGVHAWNHEPKKGNGNEKIFTLNTNTEVKNYTSHERRIEVIQKLVNKDGIQVERITDSVTLKPNETKIISQKSKDIVDPYLWDTENPYLYKLITMVKENGKVIDEERTDYGFRWISWPIYRNDGDQRFYLNGKPVFLNGVCEYEHMLGNSHAFSEDQILSRISQMKAAGFNAFRDAHQPHNLVYQQMWDKLGMLFWTQLSAHVWYDTPEFRENFKNNLREWIKERRSCPSVVLWGLQNESTLPEDFAKECTEIIREMDPTSPSQRLVTTCNGGTGTDWNVVQNWSGTYGGNPSKYAEELSKPEQLLNGEYGAWRSIDSHTEGEFEQNGVWSEDRMNLLMEMKIRLAEQAKDKVCGQFQWIYSSHDNPGRIQNEEGFRDIDRIGPFNYKGLVTPWEEPLDVYYMYRSNYVSKEEAPMVYLVSHTWNNRWTEAGMKDGIRVFSNCDEVELFNDVKTRSLGKQKRKGIGTHFIWNNVNVQYNVLYAVGYVDGKAVAEDYIVMDNLPKPSTPNFNKLYQDVKNQTAPENGYNYIYRVNCGSGEYTDENGNIWSADVHKKEGNYWGSLSWTDQFGNLPNFLASQRRTKDPIAGTKDWELFQTFRYGRDMLKYQFPLADGEYLVELYFIEPWWGTDRSMDCEGYRIFDVAVSGDTVIKNLDIFKEAGHDRLLKKTVKGYAKNGMLEISFPNTTAGQAVISAIAIASTNKNITSASASPSLISNVKGGTAKTWLDTGKEFNKLPPILYGAEWILPDKKAKKISFIVTDNADIYVKEDTGFVKTSYTKNQTVNIKGSKCVVAVPVINWIEEPNLRPEICYEAEEAVTTGSGWNKVENHRKKDGVKIEKDGEHSISWTISPGLAGVYALRFKYMNVSKEPIIANIKVLSSDDRVMREDKIQFSSAPEKWRMVSTTTGAYINAGHYKVVISGDSLNGLWLDALDMQ
ncbi:malectin domain-containing carbohydrate-binding protein [Dysgonomonas sp. 520]|uniref:beta-d-glucuronidase/beta-L-arabinofuranosidase n=1 Tax=Dysgonomonas sp. 520 TaxID=2302931 RepID=UPI0013D4E1D5|nr:malectin domain-containing carbohydrate-binding protein [Dysgonomonas sp. 520]NDW09711.1 DUF4982 domain-containing protein [Dysgonomonas sp. 520]